MAPKHSSTTQPARLNTPPALALCRARGWARLGAAQLCLGHPRAAAAAYRRGLELEGSNKEMRLGLELAQAALVSSAGRRKAVHH